MANYPSIAQLVGSKATPQSGIRLDRASNGDVRQQIIYSADRKDFKVVHQVDATDKSTLDTFYSTNKALAVTLTWTADEQNYNCIFAENGAPDYTPRGNGLWDVVVLLAQKDT